MKASEQRGILPARTEPTAPWRPSDGETLAEGATHLALVARFDGPPARDITFTGRGVRGAGRGVRQVSLGETAEDHAVEVSITI